LHPSCPGFLAVLDSDEGNEFVEPFVCIGHKITALQIRLDISQPLMICLFAYFTGD